MFLGLLTPVSFTIYIKGKVRSTGGVRRSCGN